MASPFQVFRKHQKWMIATTGLLAIFAFVFADMLTTYTGGGSQNNPAVVKTNSGEIKEFELSRMIFMQRVVNTFQQQAFQQAIAAGGRPSSPPMFRADTELEVVRTRLLAEKAEQLGFVVSDDFINHFIRQITGDAVSGPRLRDIVGNMSFANRQRVSMDMIFAGLRETLLASKLEETYVTSMNVTPAQAWENYLRLNDRVMIEVLPVSVADFVDQVPDPSEQEIKEFFDKNKEVEKLPHVVGGVQMESPDPGFRQPTRAVFQYVKAEFDKFVDLAADSVTEKEIAEYYENNKRQFIKAELFPEGDEPSKEGEKEAPKEEPGEEKSTGKEPSDVKPEAEKPVESKDEAPKDSEKPATDDTKASSESDPDNKSEPAPGDAPKDTPQAEKETNSQSSATNLDSPFQFVALQEETNESEAEEKPAAKDTPKQPGTSSQDSKAATEDGEKKPSDQEPGKKEPGKQEFDLKTDKESGVPDNILDIPELEEKEKEPEYSPLSEVSSEIRKTLANRRAAEDIENVLRKLSGEMVAYARTRDRYLAEHNGNMEGAPQPPDLIELAKQKNLADIRVLDALSIHTTDPVSFYELAKLPLGQSQLVSDGQKFFASAFVGSLSEYRPTLTRDFDGNGYLAWVTEKIDEAIPELDAVRDEVVESWKMIQARELAKKEAEKIARDAGEHPTAMAKTFASQEALASRISTTEPFSWQTLGAVPRGGQRPQVRLSEVDGVEGADQDFMKAVFSLKEGEVKTAINHDKSVVYVIRLAGRDATEEELRQRFAALPRRFAPWYQVAEQENQQQVFTALRESVEKEAGVQWIREADAPPES